MGRHAVSIEVGTRFGLLVTNTLHMATHFGELYD